MGALRASEVDLRRDRHLRRAHRGVDRHAARPARAQRGLARQSALGLRLHQADHRRPARPRGYYFEYDRDLAAEERLRFAPDEEGPDFDPSMAPRLEGADWPAERFRKIVRNYSMDYVRTILPVLTETFGEAEARHLGGVTGTLIGMQYYFETAGLLGI